MDIHSKSEGSDRKNIGSGCHCREVIAVRGVTGTERGRRKVKKDGISCMDRDVNPL